MRDLFLDLNAESRWECMYLLRHIFRKANLGQNGNAGALFSVENISNLMRLFAI